MVIQRQIELEDEITTLAGEKTNILAFRRMKAGDLKLLDSGKGEHEVTINLVAALTNCRPKVIEDLPLEDYAKAREVVGDFLKSIADRQKATAAEKSPAEGT